jgi:hypothetical protein
LVIWDLDFNLWSWGFTRNDTGFSNWSSLVVHDIIVIWFEEAIFVVSRNTNSWISHTSFNIVSEIDTHVFRDDVVSFGISFGFLTSIVNIGHSSLVLPRIRDIEEEPIISWDGISVQHDNSVLSFFLNSERVGG